MKKLFDNTVYKVVSGIIKIVFITSVVLYLGLVLVQRATGNSSVLGYRFFTVVTGSMTGVYNINDVIAVKDYDVNKLKIGDDVAYRGRSSGLEGKLITHRIINIEEIDGKKVYTTKGVSSAIEDPKISGDQILGKVVGIVPVISLLNHVVKNQLGFFLLVFCPLVLIIVLEVLETLTDIQVEKKELKLIEKNNKNTKKEDIKVEKTVDNKNKSVDKKDDEIEIL